MTPTSASMPPRDLALEEDAFEARPERAQALARASSTALRDRGGRVEPEDDAADVALVEEPGRDRLGDERVAEALGGRGRVRRRRPARWPRTRCRRRAAPSRGRRARASAAPSLSASTRSTTARTALALEAPERRAPCRAGGGASARSARRRRARSPRSRGSCSEGRRPRGPAPRSAGAPREDMNDGEHRLLRRDGCRRRARWRRRSLRDRVTSGGT